MELTKDEKDYILSLIDRNCESISKLEGAISDDDWIYEIYDIANSIREKFEKDEVLMWKRIVYQIPFVQLVKLLDEQKQYELLEFLKTHVDRNI